MEANDLQVMVQALKAVADPTRLTMLGILSDQEYSVGDLALLLDLKEPTVSHHLAKLLEVDLVEMRREGTTHLYTLQTATLQRLNRELLAPARVAALGATSGDNSWEDRVLRTFLDGERLTKIPESRKKRAVVLQWLVQKFAPDERYPEQAVNAIIKRHHPDPATLRRELVASKLMQRADGVYWRVAAEQ